VKHSDTNETPRLVFDAQVIPGQDGRAVEALCWVGRRLFSAGLNGEITEYDLENLRPRYTVEAYGGPIWTITANVQGTLLAVSPDPDAHIILLEVESLIQLSSPYSSTVCVPRQVGCEDGTVKMFEVLEDRIQFQRNLDRQKGKSGFRGVSVHEY